MFKSLLLALALGSLSLSALAATPTVTTTATGVGRNANEALADALANAVAEVNGADAGLSVNTGEAVLEGQSNTVKDGKTESTQANLSMRTTANAQLKSSGTIASYKKLSTKKLDDGRYEVTVRALVKQKEEASYEAVGAPSKKRRVAVLRPLCAESTYNYDGAVSGAALCSQLWDRFESGILARRALSLLDRKTLETSLAELGLVDSNLTSDVEKAKLQQIRGADILLMADVVSALQGTHSEKNPMTGQVKSSDYASLEVAVRAVSPATGEVLLSKTYRSTRDRNAAMDAIARQINNDLVAVAAGRAPTPEVEATLSESRPLVRERAEAPIVRPAPTEDEGGVRLPMDP